MTEPSVGPPSVDPPSVGPIVKQITVPLSPDRAFKLFTQEMADWWPLETHSLSAQGEGNTAPHVEVPAELGAQVLETLPDGSKAPWGRVTEYDPGKAFAMSWHVGRPEDQSSHVRVSFDVVADGTRVTLVHDNWAAMGEGAATLRAGYNTGWDMVLGGRYLDAATRLSCGVGA